MKYVLTNNSSFAECPEIELSISGISLEKAMEILSLLNVEKKETGGVVEMVNVVMASDTERYFRAGSEFQHFDKIKCVKSFCEITKLGLFESKNFTDYNTTEIRKNDIPELHKAGIFVKLA